jgi:thioredoxin 1
MLNTKLDHITSTEEFQQIVSKNENVMICCGREGPMCLPVYDVMDKLKGKYDCVEFRDMDFDDEVSKHIKALPEVRGFMGLPFTVYFKNGKVVKATSSIQNKAQVTDILKSEFGECA